MVAKISISIPKELLAMIEKERAATGQSRSDYLCAVVKAHLKKKHFEELDKQYRRAYELQPETEEELAFFREAAKVVWENNPWEVRESEEKADAKP